MSNYLDQFRTKEMLGKFACFSSYLVYEMQKEKECLKCKDFIQCMQKIILKQNNLIKTFTNHLTHLLESKKRFLKDMEEIKKQYGYSELNQRFINETTAVIEALENILKVLR